MLPNFEKSSNMAKIWQKIKKSLGSIFFFKVKNAKFMGLRGWGWGGIGSFSSTVGILSQIPGTAGSHPI